MHGSLEWTISVVAGKRAVGIGRISQGSVRANQGHVRETRVVQRSVAGSVAIVIRFKTVGFGLVGNLDVANRNRELNRATETGIGIEVVIPAAESHQITAIHRTAEPFKAVILDIGTLHVVDYRLATHGAKSQAIDFLVSVKLNTTVFDTDITENAGIVVVILATVHSTRTTFHLGFARVDYRLAAENHAAPVTVVTLAGRFVGSEDNRIFGRTFGHQLAAAFHNQSRLGTALALDYRTGRNRQGSPIHYVNEAVQGIDRIGRQSTVAFDFTFQDRIAGNDIITTVVVATIFVVAGGERQHSAGHHGHQEPHFHFVHFHFVIKIYRFIFLQHPSSALRSATIWQKVLIPHRIRA